MSIASRPPEFFSEVDPDLRSARAIRADLSCSFSRWEIKLVLHAFFQRHILTTSPQNNSHYCCGIKSGEVQIHFPECELLYCDGDEYIKSTVERHRHSKFNKSTQISPEVSVDTPAGKASLKIGSHDDAKESVSDTRVEYTLQEAVVALVPHKKGAAWVISMAKSDEPPIDYLHRRFSFNLQLKGQRSNFKGKLVIRPGSFSVFDSRGKFVSDKFTVKALLLAAISGKKLSRLFCREYEVYFEAEQRS